MITTVCKISYGSQTVPQIVPAVQGDTGRAIRFEIADYTPPAGATATYFIDKPSGEAIYNSATITDNSILCELTAQSLAEAGENYMQVRIIVDEDIVTSFDVILLVRPFRGIGAVESTSEINIFDKAVEKAAEDFQEQAEQIVEEVIESIPADYTELTEEVEQLNERLSDVKTDLENRTELLDWNRQQFIILNVDPVDLTPTSNNGIDCIIIDCVAGEKYAVTADGGNQSRAWGFLDNTNHVLSVADANTHAEGLEITAPTNAVKLVVNNRAGLGFEGHVYKIINRITSLENNLTLLSDEIPNTIQIYTFVNGQVSQISHTRNNVAIRTDAFVYSASTITETRTLNTGEILTITTNLETLETSVAYTEA